MARHHIRDNEGNLHIYNDEEYKQYKYRNGCLGVMALLIFCVGGALNKCSNDEKTSSDPKVEKVVNSEIQNLTEESADLIDRDLSNNEIEESEVEGTLNQNVTKVNNIPVQENNQDESAATDNANEDSTYGEIEESDLEDPKLVKKLEKEERKRQKKLEKEAKRKAKAEAKEAKRKAKEEAKETMEENNYN